MLSSLPKSGGMNQFKVPNTYIIIFSAIIFCAVVTWLVPGAVPQTWEVFSALYEGFRQQSGIIAFVLVLGGAFWIVNSTRAVDDGIYRFIGRLDRLEKYSIVRTLGVGNIVITLVMLLFGLFGAVFGMSEETIAFVAVVIPLAKSLGYDEMVGVCMVYVAAHVGFAGAMLNPFTIGIAQDMAGIPLFSGIEYRTVCWLVLMAVAISFVLWYASGVKKQSSLKPITDQTHIEELPEITDKKKAWITLCLINISLLLFAIFYASECVVKIGQTEFSAPWLLWTVNSLFLISSVLALKKSVRLYILDQLLFTILYLVTGVMGYGWYLSEICALFLALGVSAGFSAGYSADTVSKEFINGAKDIFSAAVIIGLAAGIIVILERGEVIDRMLASLSDALQSTGKAGALGAMYGIQTFINIFIPSASAKAAVTIPIMAPFADMIGVSRQATVLAFQFGDGFTNMITPCSGVLMAVLSVAKIPYERWFGYIWKFILMLIVLGFLLLLPTIYLNLPGF